MNTFSFLNPADPSAMEKNWRQFAANSTFREWTPATADITNVSTTKGYAQLYGPMVYYWIMLRSTSDVSGIGATHMASGAVPKITNMPYGPQTPSNMKSSPLIQWMDCLDSTGTDVVANQRAMVSTSGSSSYIYLPVGAGWTGKARIYLYGWIFRD